MRRALLVAPLLLAACRHEGGAPPDRPARDAVAALDTALASPAPSGLDTTAVVPGQRLGPVPLGTRFDSLLVAYGQPPRSDADTASVWGAWPRGDGWLDVYALADPSGPALYRVVQVRADVGTLSVEGVPAALLTRGVVAAQYPKAEPFGADGLYDRTRGLGFTFSGRGASAPAEAVVVVAPGTPASALRSVADGA